MSSTTTHYLSKEEVSEKLQGVSYSFNESYWESFQESQSTAGTSKFVSPKTPSIKLTPKLIAIPISLIALSAIIYFSITNLRSENSSKDSGKNTEKATVLTQPQPKENVVVAPITNSTTPVVKQETPVNPNTNTPKQEPMVISKETTKTEKKEDTSAASTQTAKTVKEEKNKVVEQTSVVTEEKKESTTKKKKKKRNRKKDSGNTTLVPSPEEDNVVIPEN